MNRSRRTPVNYSNSTDDGFSLIEVIVALVLLGIVATASLAFFLRGMQSTTDLQRRQSSVGVANEAMERARALSARPMGASGVTALVSGRVASAVTASWPVTGSADDVTMYPASDPAATTTSVAALPIARTTTDAGVLYTVTTLVGACFRSVAAGDQPCGRVAGVADASAVAPPGTIKMARVVVIVTWSAIKDACGAGPCTYRVSALVDPSKDAVWNTVTDPVAFDDVVTLPAGTALTIDVLVNDQLGRVTSQPTIITAPLSAAHGTTTINANGSVLYHAPSSASGIYTFGYKLKDAAGKLSNVATVTMKVTPDAVDDIAATSRSEAITIPVTANDKATAASIAIVNAPGNGSAVVSGTNVVYTANATYVGFVTLDYALTDSAGQVSAPATLTISVASIPAPLAADISIDIPSAKSENNPVPLNLLALTGNSADSTITVVSADGVTAGTLKMDGNGLNAGDFGSSLEYAPHPNALEVLNFTYYITNADKFKTESKKVTLRVIPVAVDDSFSVPKSAPGGTSLSTLDIGSNDQPSSFGGSVKVSANSLPNCGSLPAAQPGLTQGKLTYLPPVTPGTCTLQYSIQSVADGALVSKLATVTITVTD